MGDSVTKRMRWESERWLKVIDLLKCPLWGCMDIFVRCPFSDMEIDTITNMPLFVSSFNEVVTRIGLPSGKKKKTIFGFKIRKKTNNRKTKKMYIYLKLINYLYISFKIFYLFYILYKN